MFYIYSYLFLCIQKIVEVLRWDVSHKISIEWDWSWCNLKPILQMTKLIFVEHAYRKYLRHHYVKHLTIHVPHDIMHILLKVGTFDKSQPTEKKSWLNSPTPHPRIRWISLKHKLLYVVNVWQPSNSQILIEFTVTLYRKINTQFLHILSKMLCAYF